MDYQLNIYTSNEKEIQNIKADNKTKQIKVLQEQKLAPLYKKTFGPAVKKYNERAKSAKMIDDYYQSIVDSNVPELYKISILVHHELQNKTEIATIQKAFLEFKKKLEQYPWIVLVSTYMLVMDEYKELQIFFYPVSDGYQTGMSVRNDLIDVTKKLLEIDQKEHLNILKAVPLFKKHIDGIFREAHEGQIASQEDVASKARGGDGDNPLTLHAIAVETLKAHMNSLQKINAENQQLQQMVAAEKERIQHDIEWSKRMEQEIYVAEEERIEEEKRLAEEARQAEEARRIMEAQKREEDRLREEERRIEADRLAEMARRNIELRRKMEMQEEEEQRRVASRMTIDREDFARMLNDHMRWQDDYNVDESCELENLPFAALKDDRRIAIEGALLTDIEFDRTVRLIGASFENCEFNNCRISVELIATSVESCVFKGSILTDSEIKRCSLSGLNMNQMYMDNIKVDDTMIMKASFRESVISELVCAPATSFIRCNFSNATLKGCDMKKNAFMNCNFSNTIFVTCDMRDSAFQVCNTDTMSKEGSLFKGAKFNAV